MTHQSPLPWLLESIESLSPLHVRARAAPTNRGVHTQLWSPHRYAAPQRAASAITQPRPAGGSELKWSRARVCVRACVRLVCMHLCTDVVAKVRISEWEVQAGDFGRETVKRIENVPVDFPFQISLEGGTLIRSDQKEKKWKMATEIKRKRIDTATSPPAALPCLPLSLCACTNVRSRRGLRKITAIDLRRRNVETLSDGTFSSERLQTRRLGLAKGRGRVAAAAAEREPPSGSRPQRYRRGRFKRREGFSWIVIEEEMYSIGRFLFPTFC